MTREGQAPGSSGQDERAKLRRELSRFDTVLFLISAMVVVDTIGAIAIGGPEVFTWLVVLFVFFFIPSAMISAELGAAIPEEGGVYVWVRDAIGRFAGSLTSLLYWAGTPMWLGGSVAVVAMTVYARFLGELSRPGMYLFGTLFVGVATIAAIVPLRWGKWVPMSGAVGQVLLLSFFTVSVVIYGVQHGVEGISAAELSRPVRCSSPSYRCSSTPSSGSSCPRRPRRRCTTRVGTSRLPSVGPGSARRSCTAYRSWPCSWFSPRTGSRRCMA